jgi:hypothetical protein
VVEEAVHLIVAEKPKKGEKTEVPQSFGGMLQMT